jgi:plastocyanin
MRKLGFFVALATACALVGVAPAAAQPTPEVTAYCEAALTTDKAIEKLFASERPKQKDLQAFQTALTQQESSAPPEVAATVQAAATQVRTAIPNLQNLFEDPSFEQNVNAIDEHRYSSCGYTQIDVTGNEYAFEGLPKTVPAGTVAIRFTDTGAEWHELAIYRVKGKDSVKKIVGLSEKEQRKKLEEVGGTFAMQGQTTYTIAELTKPGRYALLCHLPVGSTSIEAAEEAEKDHPKSHAEEGMYATITVEKS